MILTTLIDVETLAAHLTDPRFSVIDCRYSLDDESWGEREYKKLHIPGATFANMDRDLSGPKTGRNGRHPLPALTSLAPTLGRFGIADGIQVVAYDQDAGMYASRLWWLLRWLGHDAVAVLDGGFAKWIAGARATRSGVETHPQRQFTPAPRPDWLVNTGTVGEAIGNKEWLLVDARAPERYRGEVEPVDKVAGRIPGAMNHFYKRNVREDGTFLPPAELRTRAQASIGNTALDHVICYCGSGVTACQDLLAFEHAGLKGAKLYAGSWSEWISDPARPVERG